MHPQSYKEQTKPEYAELAAAFEWSQPRHGILLLTGPCPQCGTEIQVPVVDGVFKNTGRFKLAAPLPRLEPMICTCEEDHPGRPAGRIGCGAYWLLSVTVAKS